MFALGVVVFSVQNAEVVQINFLSWSVETSRALLMLVCVAIGSLCTILALLPTIFGSRKKEKSTHSDAEESDN